MYITPLPTVPVRSCAFQVDEDINGNQVPVRPAVFAQFWQFTRAPSSPPISPLVRLVLDAKIVNASLPVQLLLNVLVGVAVAVAVGVALALAAAVGVGVAVAVALAAAVGVLVGVAVASHAGHNHGVVPPQSYQAVIPIHCGFASQTTVLDEYPCGVLLPSQSEFSP